MGAAPRISLEAIQLRLAKPLGKERRDDAVRRSRRRILRNARARRKEPRDDIELSAFPISARRRTDQIAPPAGRVARNLVDLRKIRFERDHFIGRSEDRHQVRSRHQFLRPGAQSRHQLVQHRLGPWRLRREIHLKPPVGQALHCQPA